MIKSSVWRKLCLLLAVCSCDGCDDAATISSGRMDVKENYLINVGPYDRDRELIGSYSKKILGNDFSIDKVVPHGKTFRSDKEKNEGEYNTEVSFYVNNNIVLLKFFSCCWQEKVFIDLILDELEGDNNTLLKSKFEDMLKDFSKNISDFIEKEVKYDGEEKDNHIILDKIFEINEKFNRDVLKQILPDIVDKLDAQQKKEFEEIVKKEYLFGVAHVLLTRVIKDDKIREGEIKKRKEMDIPVPISQ